ncbi:MAG: cupin domain-containing protein [Chloroflexi bacterium]|nr:cupin domain-containing protein [Chloroflexota bacterium]
MRRRELTAERLVELLGLQPHPTEGGYFVETYRANEVFHPGGLPRRYRPPGRSSRSHSTAIYYLLTPQTVSALHRLASDEVFHFYLGDPVEMLMLPSDASGDRLAEPVRIELGPDILAGQRVQHLVPRGVWQGSRLVPGGRWALLGCTVAPGFDFGDYEHGDRADLIRRFPEQRDLVVALTPELP